MLYGRLKFKFCEGCVPTAAVILAPIMYANIVAATKLIVELLRESILYGFNKPQKNIIFHRDSIFFHR